jgi:hypothetical protein
MFVHFAGAEDEDLFACMFFEAVSGVTHCGTIIQLQTNHQLKRLHTIVAQLILRSRNTEHDNTDLAALLRRRRRRRRKRAVDTDLIDAIRMRSFSHIFANTHNLSAHNRTVSTTSTRNRLDDNDDAVRLAMYNRLLLRKYALMPPS